MSEEEAPDSLPRASKAIGVGSDLLMVFDLPISLSQLLEESLYLCLPLKRFDPMLLSDVLNIS